MPFYLFLLFFFTLLPALWVKIKNLKGFPQIKRRITVHSLFFLFLLLVITALFALWDLTISSLPDSHELTKRSVDFSTKIYDRHGRLLYTIYKDQNRSYISLNKIPLTTRLAFLAAEDRDFYNHLGFSVRGITRSTIKYLNEGTITSGSTITQQLVKNALLSPEKTVSRKFKEILLAVEVERHYTKDQILEMYLNEVSFGGTAYGIEEAARLYFGKDTKALTLAESALLAGLPKSPTKLSPFGSYPESTIERQHEILELMLLNGYITADELEIAKKEVLHFAQNTSDIKAPHFVMYVKELLIEKYGEEMVEKGGLEVITTLDLDIQRLAEKAVEEEVNRLKNLDVGNGAAVILNPQTGEILAMVGSKDYFDTASGGNVNVTIRPRQPGSSIKLVNYAYALSHGFTPATIIPDTPISFAIAGQPPYAPNNYDSKFRGNITLRSALAESRNIPAVKVLSTYGVAEMIQQGQAMGITTWTNPRRFGLSLTLGGGEVKLLDLARVYATVANLGKRPQLTSIISVSNKEGELIYSKACQTTATNRFQVFAISQVTAAESSNKSCDGDYVLDPRIAFMLIDILKDNKARSPAFGSQSALVINDHPEVAVKTGTSNDMKDNLTVGFNQDYLVAVWVGNNDSTPMSRIASGITGAAPIWNTIMSQLLAQRPAREWEVPQGLVYIKTCIQGKNEWFLEENSPKFNCNFQHIVNEKNPTQKNI